MAQKFLVLIWEIAQPLKKKYKIKFDVRGLVSPRESRAGGTGGLSPYCACAEKGLESQCRPPVKLKVSVSLLFPLLIKEWLFFFFFEAWQVRKFVCSHLKGGGGGFVK